MHGTPSSLSRRLKYSLGSIRPMVVSNLHQLRRRYVMMMFDWLIVQMSSENRPDFDQRPAGQSHAVPQTTPLFRALNFELFVKPVCFCYTWELGFERCLRITVVSCYWKASQNSWFCSTFQWTKSRLCGSQQRCYPQMWSEGTLFWGGCNLWSYRPITNCSTLTSSCSKCPHLRTNLETHLFPNFQ